MSGADAEEDDATVDHGGARGALAAGARAGPIVPLPARLSDADKSVLSFAALFVDSLRLSGGEVREVRATNLIMAGQSHDHNVHKFNVEACPFPADVAGESPAQHRHERGAYPLGMERKKLGELVRIRYSKMEEFRRSVHESPAWRRLSSHPRIQELNTATGAAAADHSGGQGGEAQAVSVSLPAASDHEESLHNDSPSPDPPTRTSTSTSTARDRLPLVPLPPLDEFSQLFDDSEEENGNYIGDDPDPAKVLSALVSKNAKGSVWTAPFRAARGAGTGVSKLAQSVWFRIPLFGDAAHKKRAQRRTQTFRVFLNFLLSLPSLFPSSEAAKEVRGRALEFILADGTTSKGGKHEREERANRRAFVFDPWKAAREDRERSGSGSRSRAGYLLPFRIHKETATSVWEHWLAPKPSYSHVLGLLKQALVVDMDCVPVPRDVEADQHAVPRDPAAAPDASVEEDLDQAVPTSITAAEGRAAVDDDVLPGGDGRRGNTAKREAEHDTATESDSSEEQKPTLALIECNEARLLGLFLGFLPAAAVRQQRSGRAMRQERIVQRLLQTAKLEVLAEHDLRPGEGKASASGNSSSPGDGEGAERFDHLGAQQLQLALRSDEDCQEEAEVYRRIDTLLLDGWNDLAPIEDGRNEVRRVGSWFQCLLFR